METVEVIPRWFVDSFAILTLILVLVIWSVTKNMSNRKKVKGQMLVEMWRTKGTVEEEFYPIDTQEITVKIGDVSTKYYINPDCVYQELYPKKAWFPWTQVTVQKVAFKEGDPEPIVKRSKSPVVTPKLIEGLREEKMTQFVLQVSPFIKELSDIASRFPKPQTIYLLIGAACIAAIVGAVMSYMALTTVNDLAEGIGKILGGLGL